jgi:anti-sigma B factor antagonist
MPLTLETRQVGNVVVIQCAGRIVEGQEGDSLRALVLEKLVDYRHFVLDFAKVAFVDSGGLGLLLRLHGRVQQAQGDLKFCAVGPNIAEVLRVTRLQAIFDTYDTVADAVTALYQPWKTPAAVDRFTTDILCIEPTDDTLAYLGQLLGQAGYGVVTASNVPDAVILLSATQPRAVVVAHGLYPVIASWSTDAFSRLSQAGAVIELPADFTHQDAGDAGRQLLERVRLVLGGETAVTDS